MQPLPTADLRSNQATWAVPQTLLPAVGNWMHDVLPNEAYDPHFRGQRLETTYFDTRSFALRKARLRKTAYLTLRVRRYRASEGEDVFALSAKTESQKFRVEIAAADAGRLLELGFTGPVLELLPPDLLARLLELAADEAVLPCVTVGCHRYAVEDAVDRYTLDVGIHTDTGKQLSAAVLEFKSTQRTPLPGSLRMLGLRPIKLSKFLWATEV